MLPAHHRRETRQLVERKQFWGKISENEPALTIIMTVICNWATDWKKRRNSVWHTRKLYTR